VDATIRAFEIGAPAAGEVSTSARETVTRTVRRSAYLGGNQRPKGIDRAAASRGLADQQHTSARIEKARKIPATNPPPRGRLGDLRAQFECNSKARGAGALKAQRGIPSYGPKVTHLVAPIHGHQYRQRIDRLREPAKVHRLAD
jgi:hypothetical protein